MGRRRRIKGQTTATDAAALDRISAKTESHVISHPALFLHLKVTLPPIERHRADSPSPSLPGCVSHRWPEADESCRDLKEPGSRPPRQTCRSWVGSAITFHVEAEQNTEHR